MKHWNLAAAILSTVLVPALVAAAEPVVVIEAKVFRLRDAACQEMKLAEACPKENSAKPLDAAAEAALTKSLCEQKEAGGLEVLAEPRLIVNDNQTGTIRVGSCKTFLTGVIVKADKQGSPVMVPKEEAIELGLNMQFTPQIFTDRRFIRLKYSCTENSVEDDLRTTPVTIMLHPVFEGGSQGQPVPFTQFIQQPKIQSTTSVSTVAIPVGGSVLVRLGSRACESKCVCKMPVLSDIPLLEEFFTNTVVSKDTEHSWMLLTANIVAAPPEAPTPAHRFAMGNDLRLTFPPLGANPCVLDPSCTPCLLTTVLPYPVAAKYAVPAVAPVSAPPAPECFACPAMAIPPLPVAPAFNQPVAPPLMTQAVPPCVGCHDHSGGSVLFGALQTVPPMPSAKTVRCDGNVTMNTASNGNMMLKAEHVEIATSAPVKNAAILKILLEQYDVACKTGDAAKARTIAAYCLEMDPTCFAKR
jgi:hypothetical protein